MIDVRPVGPDDWRRVRQVRLAALREAPYAFGSTYERERTFGEAKWRARIAFGAKYLAWVGGRVAGHAGGVPSDGDPRAVDLVSMWVRPAGRGLGVGEALVATVAAWARAQAAARLDLWVTDTNGPARRLYERCGFTPTGERRPLPSDPSLFEIQMTRPLAGGHQAP
jgi:ribosomal protein S18 acetylase RimI-like enzyme